MPNRRHWSLYDRFVANGHALDGANHVIVGRLSLRDGVAFHGEVHSSGQKALKFHVQETDFAEVDLEL